MGDNQPPVFAFCPGCHPQMLKALTLMPVEFRHHYCEMPCMRHFSKDRQYVLWLDDIRDPASHGYVGAKWVKTADEAIAELKTGGYYLASLDHDLSIAATMGQPAPDEKTGYTVACWLEENPQYLPASVHAHSMNPLGAARMRMAIDSAYRRAGRTNLNDVIG